MEENFTQKGTKLFSFIFWPSAIFGVDGGQEWVCRKKIFAFFNVLLELMTFKMNEILLLLFTFKELKNMENYFTCKKGVKCERGSS